MGGIIIKKPLKNGESITGKVCDVFEETVALELADGKKVKLPLPKEVLETINNDHNGMFEGDTIKISLKDEEYEIEEVEEKD